MEKRIKYGGSFLLLLLAGMALYVYIYEYRLSRTSTTFIKGADIHISARKLTSLFDSSEATSGQRFLYKVLSVSGILKKIGKNEQGGYSVDLDGVRCSLDSLYNSQPPDLNIGDSLSIRGVCAGHLSNVLMVQCIIEK
ncbi:MAG TPA: hypothetical protein VK563_12890 [Puia sp.]|nr:hypothetical protein [Puia sp.]